MTASPAPVPSSPAEWLRHGQALEAQGEFRAAIFAYDQAVAGFAVASDDDLAARRALGLAWMNRGNALQKLAIGLPPEPERAATQAASVTAYDEAIARFKTLPVAEEPAFRNHLGAAWLNRGHALLGAERVDDAEASFAEAIVQLRQLPADADLAYRLNLAGAYTNLAHVLIASDCGRARLAARDALEVLAGHENAHPVLVEMSLRARRALVTALGALLVEAEAARQPIGELAAEASDVVDDGLALAREAERRGTPQLRPLALRLFRLGAQLYRVHQPHFLAEFVLENLAPDAFGREAEFRAAADEALAFALGDLQQRPQLLIAGSADATRAVETARSLRAAQRQLSLPSSASA